MQIHPGSRSLLSLYEVVWNTERKPETWRDSVLIQLPKSQKEKENLNNRRHIHTQEEFRKCFMHIVTNEAKPKVFKELSPFQIGAVPGHRAQEHLFSIKSIIAMVEMTNDTIGLQLFDCSKMFDREVLVDCMDELYKSNIKGKLYKLIFEMNRDVRIRVRTPVGVSNVEEVGKTVAQGSLEGAIVSTNSVGN